MHNVLSVVHRNRSVNIVQTNGTAAGTKLKRLQVVVEKLLSLRFVVVT